MKLQNTINYIRVTDYLLNFDLGLGEYHYCKSHKSFKHFPDDYGVCKDSGNSLSYFLNEIRRR